VRIENSTWNPSVTKNVSASRRSDQQKGLLEERKIVAIQFGNEKDQKDKPNSSDPDEEDYVIDLHA
jgi:hypothetical protein